MAFDSPIGYTAHYNFPKYALGANPGADALNQDLIEAIDTKIYEIQSGATNYTFTLPLKNTSSVITLEYEDNLKKSTNNKLDTVQAIKTTSNVQFARIGIGGIPDAATLNPFIQKVYGNSRITGSLTVDGEIYIGGSINQMNVNDLNVVDHAIKLNKYGDDTTAINGGLIMLGSIPENETEQSTKATLLYNGSAWVSSLNVDIATGKVFKINATDVLSATSLGTGVVNSSLTKVGIVTSGEWKATQIADAYIVSAANWNTAFTNNHTHTNKTTLDAINQSVSTTASPTFNNITLTNGELATGGTSNLVLNPLGKSIVPKATFDVNLGAVNLKYLSIYAAEMIVGNLVSQNTISTIGGRILVGVTTSLTRAITSGDSTIYVKHNSLNVNDVIYFEANGNIEFMKILAGAYGNSPEYYYTVQRNLDGTGANSWNAGDACFNTGQVGSGFLDLYSINGVKGSQYGPAIVGNVRNSLTYNDWSEVFAIGNLNGLYGYNTNTYGVGLGKYSANASYLLADATNGIQIKKGSTTLAQWDVSGNILVGETGAGKCNVYISAGVVQLRNNTTSLITLNADGSGAFAGNITSTATITGGTIIGSTVKSSNTNGTCYVALTDETINYISTGVLSFGYDATNTIVKTYSSYLTDWSQTWGEIYKDHKLPTNKYNNNFVRYIRDAYPTTPTVAEYAKVKTATNPGVYSDFKKYFGYYQVHFGYKIYFGNGDQDSDVTLYRDAANILKTDDTFDALRYKINGSVGTAGNFLRSDGTNGFVSSAIQVSDIPAHTHDYAATNHTHTSFGAVSFSEDITLGKSFIFNNIQSYNITTTDNTNGYFIMTGGKNILKLSSDGEGYIVGIWGLTDKAPIWVINVGIYSIKVEGFWLRPGKSMWVMFDNASTAVRTIGENKSMEWAGRGTTTLRPPASLFNEGASYWNTDEAKLQIVSNGNWQTEF